MEALAITDCESAAGKIETIFRFISYDVQLTHDLDSTHQALESGSRFVIALVLLREQDDQAQALSYLAKHAPALPVYLLREESEAPADLAQPKSVKGVMPFPLEYRRLLSTIRQAEQHSRLHARRRDISTTLTGASAAVREVQALIRQVSMTDANVLLTGESGTGKEVVARGIHNLSPRNDKPFVAVNCGAIPAELLESELFGHEKGAFSGAISQRKGRFELADGGTLFLDEIGDMPMNMQVKLLRVIQERTFERVGGHKTMSSNVRLIAATHQNLEQQIEDGKFRLDLFYRLNVFPIELPSLRHRTEDIPTLIQEFSTRMEVDQSSPIAFDESALEALRQHPLPGNVRELENLVERLAILYPGETVTSKKLPQRYRPSAAPEPYREPVVSVQDNPEPAPAAEAQVQASASEGSMDLKQYLSNLERTIIEQALEKSNWVVAKAAKNLSLQRTTLVEKIKKYDLQNSM